MPLKLTSQLQPENAEARIEIIPLIDIMFFLLASFMLVSLSMVNLASVKVNLPTASSAVDQSRSDFADISVDQAGTIYLNKRPMAGNELIRALIAARQAHPNLRVLVSGDRDAHYGDAVRALDLVHSAGIDNVALEIKRAPP
ncbi:MAG TPA: biopolymer transporter ExbD [Tepidisphaeraceae bacterium]|nr:biopolymer transporter ExbD [Tepidisphaeraceae bacterium]